MRRSRVTRPLTGGLLATALVAAGLLATTPAASSAAPRTRTTGALARLTLPAPTGPDTIGTA
ncbi:MAG: hypothetical protein JWP48_4164, partial [Actinoallomurus sp.]|nr:hypothetical protein [Actinoallomurus sp.]